MNFKILFPAGHYLMTELLLDKLIETSKRTGIQGRIINVSSVVHCWVKKDDLCFTHLLNPNKLEKLEPITDYFRLGFNFSSMCLFDS